MFNLTILKESKESIHFLNAHVLLISQGPGKSCCLSYLCSGHINVVRYNFVLKSLSIGTKHTC